MCIIDSLVSCPTPHPGALARPSIPVMLQARAHISTPYPSTVFTFGHVIEFIKEFGVHHLKGIIKGVS